MLEVKGLKKIYTAKNGVAVNALDGIDISFPEKGMVFLLGKSGSGKSTLLNVCGGLDAPTEGEIIVKGRSSKAFSQSDFDSYRNTFIGFIFQEYNILNEFTVEDNIALALELQGKSKDKKAIDDILEQVDLKGYGKRKPNTLSGGQKQRIAIARALVKSPEIIMADEPTGALDSNTGRQVFETLKKLSMDKLVIVVSHDRDFAQQYGDRIIELCDGKVSSDISKTLLKDQAVSENITALGDVLCLKKGSVLTDNDFEKIKSFLKNADTDIVIARDKNEVAAFKKLSHISDEGYKEVFAETNNTAVEKKQYKPEDSRFIRSKLPLRHATRIGLSSLKNKPFRLVFTVFLCVIAFTLFGLFSTLSFYNTEATFKQSINDNGSGIVILNRSCLGERNEYSYGELLYTFETISQGKFTPAELAQFQSTFGNDVFGAVSVSTNISGRQAPSNYWQPIISAFGVMHENNSMRATINGKYPVLENEILISEYTAESLFNGGIYADDGSLCTLNSYTDIIGKTINIDGEKYTVTGLFNGGAIDPEYDALKENDINEQLSFEFNSYLSSNMNTIAFVSEAGIDEIDSRYNYRYNENLQGHAATFTFFNDDGSYDMPDYTTGYYQAISDSDSNGNFFFDGSKTALNDNEVLLPENTFYMHFRDTYFRTVDEQYHSRGEELPEQVEKMMSVIEKLYYGGEYTQPENENDKSEFVPLTQSERSSLRKQAMEFINTVDFNYDIMLQVFSESTSEKLGQATKFTVVGLVENDQDNPEYMIVNDAVYKQLWDVQSTMVEYYSEYTSKYVEPADAKYRNIYLINQGTDEQIDKLWEYYNVDHDKFDESGSQLRLSGGFVDNLYFVDEFVSVLSKVFLYVGLAMALFAILLFSNFISASITQKKREIGILRAVGARSFDVFKIFFSESFFISAICVVISIIASVLLCMVFNNVIASAVGASLFVFGPLSFATLLVFAFATSVLSTFLPVYKAAKKKPVDSIRSL